MKNDSSLEDFKKSRVFVMTRTNDNGQIGLTIQTDQNSKHQDELQELYHVTFYDVVLNLGNWFKEPEYKIILKVITPALAQVFYNEFSDKCLNLIEDYMEQEKSKKVVAALKATPDKVSIVQYILNDYFIQFNKIKTEKGLDQALTEMGEFFQDMEFLFYKLPACYCFILGDFVSLWKPAK